MCKRDSERTKDTCHGVWYLGLKIYDVLMMYLLNDAVLNVDIGLLGEVIIDDLSSLDKDTH